MMMHEREEWDRRRREADGEARFEYEVGQQYTDPTPDNVVHLPVGRTWTPEQVEMLEGMGVTFVDYEFTPDDGGDAA